jgi:predicted DNA-binding protein with PD1-like motif
LKRWAILLGLLWALTLTAFCQEDLRIITLRLSPKQDLKKELQALVEREKLEAGFIMTTVGSLSTLKLRLADQHNPTVYPGPFEIVSLVGTLSPQGLHLHLSASDSNGRTLGGHLVDGNIIYTTAEIVIGVPTKLRYKRVLDPASGFPELKVETK